MNAQKLLSIVVPVFNEETNIEPFYAALAPVMDGLDVATEVLFVDDGSSDRSFERISGLAARDPRIRCLRFSRNFGSHPAVLAGLRNCAGDAAVMMSVDLQDPPEMIRKLSDEWQKGAHVVWAVRETRDDPWSKKVLANSFYWLFRRVALENYPPTGMDFGLFDHKVLECLRNYEERNAFIVGTIVWLGFNVAYVHYHRRARHSGHTKWSLGKRIKNALDAFVSFSHVPIRLISYSGLFVSFLSVLYAMYIMYRRFTHGDATSGWPSLMTAILFLGGVQLIMLGVVGEYLWRGVDQSRGRPQYIVMDKLGFETAENVANTRALRERNS